MVMCSLHFIAYVSHGFYLQVNQRKMCCLQKKRKTTMHKIFANSTAYCLSFQ